MRIRKLVSSIVIATLGFSSVAIAQPAREARQDLREAQRDARDARQDIRGAQRELRRADTPRERREARQNLREAQRDLREARQDRREARQDLRYYYNAREFRRGGRLPPELRTGYYVVHDWRGHRLSAPPRGYHWVQVGPDYVLAAIATGVIANLILNQ